MNARALEISRELAALLQGDATVLCFPEPSAPAAEKPADSVQSPQSTKRLVADRNPAVPLSRAEREFAQQAATRVRDFIISRRYAQERIRARRAAARLA